MTDELFDQLDHAYGSALHAPPSPSRNVKRRKIRPADLCAGCIVWLPAKHDSNGGIKCCCARCPVAEGLDDGGYNHPVIVLKICQATDSNVRGNLVCEVACITSFSSMSLQTYQNKRRKVPHFHDSIPITHPESGSYAGEQLKLEKKNKLDKQSYVRLNHIYRIEASKLRGFVKRACNLRLDENSYEALMGKLKLSKDDWVNTNKLRQTKDQRLLALANSNPSTQQTSTHQPADTVGDYSSHLYRIMSETTPQTRPHSNTALPITPQPYRTHLPDNAHSTRAVCTPLVTPQQQARTYYNPPTWPTTTPIAISQRTYGTVYPDRYIQPRSSSSYAPPRPDPEDESSSWLFAKCLVGFIAVGGLVWWWDASSRKR